MRPSLAILSLCSVLLLGFVILSSTTARTHAPVIVTFADADIEAAVRAAINQPTGPLDAQRVATVTELDLHEKRVLDLTGLEACTGLKKLNLASNFAVPRPWCTTDFVPALDNVDLTPIASLRNLEELDLSMNDIGDISALTSLQNLLVLNLVGNDIQDLTPLEQLSQLKELHLVTNSDAPSWTSLGHLTQLEVLNTNGYPGGLIAGIAPCKKLRILRIYAQDSEHEGLSGLAGFPQLQELALPNSRLSDAAGLEACTNLRVLDLSENQIGDLSSLSGLRKLEVLTLDGNGCMNLAPLATCANLRSLQATYLYPRWTPEAPQNGATILNGVSTFASLSNLETLILPDMPSLDSLAVLGTLPSLTMLTCYALGTNDLAGLGRSPSLKSLTCSIAPGADLGQLREASRLTDLAVTFDDGLDLTQLATCPQITQLTLNSRKSGADLTPLATMASLDTLALSWDSGSWDVSPLGQCPSLRMLEFSGSDDQSIAGLAACDQVERVVVENWFGESNLGTFADMANLRTLEVLGGQNHDLALLVDCPKLEKLVVRGFLLRNVDAVENLPSLRELDVSGSALEAEIPPLISLAGGLIVVTQNDARLIGFEELAQFQLSQRTSQRTERIGGWGTDPLLPVEDVMDIPDTVVRIPSSQLESILTSALTVSVDDLTLRQLARIQTYIGGRFADIRGLEYCVNLEHIDLSYTEDLRDIRAVAGMKRLKTINLDSTKVADLTPLASCPSLEAISLSGWVNHENPGAPTNLPSFAPLGKLPKLTQLDISYSGVSDLSDLAECRHLEILELGSNPRIRDVTPLASLKHLKTLDLEGCNIADVTPLGQLTALETFRLSVSPTGGMYIIYESPTGSQLGQPAVTGLAALGNLSNVRTLRLDALGSSDVDFMKGMTSLEEVTMELCMLQSLDGFGGHPQLRKISLNKVEATSLEGLVDLPSLVELRVEGSDRLTDISAVAGLPKLRQLTISGGVTSYEVLRGCTTLQELSLNGNQGTDITPLSSLTNLRVLNLDHLGESEWIGNDRRKDPRRLDDLSPLRALMRLESLSISRSRVTDLSPLAGLSRLKGLHCYEGTIEDLAPLATGLCLQNGSTLNLEENPLSVESKKIHVRTLQSRGVDVMY